MFDFPNEIIMKVTGIFMLLFWVFQTGWSMTRFGERLCNNPDYTCITIKRGDSWAQMFPNAQEREIVQRVNRMNIFLQPDMVIAIPKNLSQITLNDVSPFPRQINPDGEK